ncbi:response regulator [Chitinimonas arctica]|uniref:Response regulator n=1 Tax=Chitinimonas arctica TaxID=2594795 RepID=A0A516SI93_9NEIS|nr:response regulator [Chitinimonas arctica]QDQ27865.1 response regulator [Chitinimonas arctica]
MSQTELATPLPRILVVDDSRIVRATVKKHLSTQFDVIEAADGEAGWERLEADPDVLVLMSDLSMPKLDGFGLLARVRKSADARIKHTPVIIISGEEDAETKQLAVERGANDFVTKSTDRAEMLARVSAAVKLAKTARELRTTEEVQARTTTTDTQTGVATEHMLHVEADKAMAHATRYHGETTLVLFEIDRFDSLRAELGEAVADQLINLVAKLVSGRLRKEETLARLTGPRFGVMLYADLAGSRIYAERLQETIAAARVNFKGRQIQITANIGMANAQADGTANFDELLAKAVHRLEQAYSVDRALELISQGELEDVMARLPALMAKLAPLLALTR